MAQSRVLGPTSSEEGIHMVREQPSVDSQSLSWVWKSSVRQEWQQRWEHGYKGNDQIRTIEARFQRRALEKLPPCSKEHTHHLGLSFSIPFATKRN